MRSSVRSRLAPPNFGAMFSMVSTEPHLVCTIFVQPRVFSRHSISPKRSEKDGGWPTLAVFEIGFLLTAKQQRLPHALRFSKRGRLRPLIRGFFLDHCS